MSYIENSIKRFEETQNIRNRIMYLNNELKDYAKHFKMVGLIEAYNYISNIANGIDQNLLDWSDIEGEEVAEKSEYSEYQYHQTVSKMLKNHIEVGGINMKVKIKTWNQMQMECGLDNAGDIKCRMYFTTEMEECLPKNRIIEISKREDQYYNWFSKLEKGIGPWVISEDMIEEIIENK
jgi:hypothetical protein